MKQDNRRFDPVVRLGWVSFFTDVATEMIYPLIPLFFVNVLAAPVRALGLVEGLAEGLVSFLKGWSGFHFDRTGKRIPFILWGYGLSALTKPLFAVATVWPMVLVARMADRFGKGIRTTARDAVIADAAGKDLLGKAYGLHRGMDTAGAFTGVALLLMLLSLGWSYRPVFYASVVPGIVAVAIAFTVRDPKHGNAKTAGTKTAARLRDLPSAYWRALTLTVVFALANSSDHFLLLRANKLGFGLMDVVLGYLLYNLTYTVLSYPAGLLSDKIGRWTLLALGWTIYAGVYLGFGMLGAAWIWPLFAVYGCYMGLTDGVSKALIAQHAPEGSRGTALGLYFMATGLAFLVGNTLTGLLWDRFGAPVTLTVAACIAAVAVALIPITRFAWPRPRKVV